MHTWAVIAIAAFCLAGCQFQSATPPLPAGPFEPHTYVTPKPPPRRPSDRTKLLAQLDAARAFWNVEGPLRYQLTVTLGCWCDPGVPLVSEVSGVAVVRSTGGHRSDGRNWEPSLRTVELLFLETRQAIVGDAEEVVVEFDPRYRYPSFVRIDEWRNASGDAREWIAEVRVLRE